MTIDFGHAENSGRQILLASRVRLNGARGLHENLDPTSKRI
jgi:hypothetical protein